jgi:superfamily I DNA/RNA helicase
MDTKRISSGLESLNDEQRTAARHHSGPLLVIAGAGTGKTKSVAARVANLIAMGADPGRILLLTFTRRSAEEMIRRAGAVVGESIAKQVQGGTFMRWLTDSCAHMARVSDWARTSSSWIRATPRTCCT